MANNDCLPQVHGCRIRIAELDPSGVPNPGAGNLIVSDALSVLSVTPVYEDGDEIAEKSACGALAISYEAEDSFKRIDGELTIMTHDPYLMAALGQGDVLTDAGINGFAVPPIGILPGRQYSVEVWAKRIDDGLLHDELPYAWWVVPLARKGRMGARTFNNGAALPTFTFKGYENPNWYDGPLNDWPVASDRALQWFPVATMPDATCGATALAAS